MQLELVPAKPDHVPELGRICYEALKDIHDRHGFPWDIIGDMPSPSYAAMILGMLVQREDCYVVAALNDGRPVGSSGLQMSDEVAGVGPVTVDVPAQGQGIGRELMHDVIARARAEGMEMVRLMQDSFNVGSLSLYASLGFDTKEVCALMEPVPGPAPDDSVRPVAEADLPAIEELSRRIYRVSRRNEVAGLMRGPFRSFLRQRHGRPVGYFIMGLPGHGVAETEDDLVALVREAARQTPGELRRCFCPLREGSLYRKFLAAGFRNIKVMNLMALGPYQEPDGVWMPSIGF